MTSRPFIVSQIIIVILAFILFIGLHIQVNQSGLPQLSKVGDFRLTSQDNKTFALDDLKGKVWVADFIFTTCGTVCPMMTKHMGQLQQSAPYPDVRLVSFSVNPENDTPEVLKTYAVKESADERWVFLTGPRDHIQDLAVKSFKMGDMKEIIFHSTMFCLVDRNGFIRGYYDSTDADRLQALRRDLNLLRKEIVLPLLPTINASLNGLAGLFLFLGFLAIKRKDKQAHRKWMISAFACSALFLCTYIYYHVTSHVISKYPGTGLLRGVYFFILGTHTPLAALIVPFILLAIRHALKGDFQKHTAITKWLYPAWTYVSVTGVMIYLMLYVFRPA